MHEIEIIAVPFNASYAFSFERKFVFEDTRYWMSRNWHRSFYYAVAYVLAVHSGRWLIRHHRRYELRPLLFLWNLCLACFSVLGTCRMLPELVFVLRNFGFEHSVCDEGFVRDSKISGFWTWAFAMSKLVELGDTAFVLLRKQPLTFLHWFHHATALMSVWYSYANAIGLGRWVVLMNYAAHSLMYTYYALKALRVNMPRWVSIFITCAQMSQMTAGVYVAWSVFFALQSGRQCTASYVNTVLCGFVYTVNWLMFANFFYKAYLQPRSRKSIKPD